MTSVEIINLLYGLTNTICPRVSSGAPYGLIGTVYRGVYTPVRDCEFAIQKFRPLDFMLSELTGEKGATE